MQATGEARPALPRALWALQLTAAIVIADAIFAVVETGSVALLARGIGFEQMGPLFQGLQLYGIAVPLLLSVAFAYASALPEGRSLLRAAAAVALVAPACGITWLLGDWMGWLSAPSGLAQVLSWSYVGGALAWRILLVVACARLSGGALAGEARTAAGLVVATSVFFVAFGNVGALLDLRLEHPVMAFLMRTAAHFAWAWAVARLVLRCASSFDSAGAGSWSSAEKGLTRYRQAVVWRIVMAFVMLVLGFGVATSRQAMLGQLFFVVAGAAALLIAVHGVRGIYGLTRMPQAAGATVAALVAFVLMVGVLCFSGIALALLPGLFSGGGGDPAMGVSAAVGAISTMAALGSLTNLVGLVSVLAVLTAISRVARYLEDEELRRSAIGLMFLIVFAAVGIAVLQVAEPSDGGAGGGVFLGLVVGISALVALVWYVKILGRVGAVVAARESVQQPLATARAVD